MWAQSAYRNFQPRGKFFTAVTDVWPHANWAVVTNNLTAIIEVVLIDVALVGGFLYTECTLDYEMYDVVDSLDNLLYRLWRECTPSFSLLLQL